MQRVTVKMPVAPLTPRPDKATKPYLHVPVDLLEGKPRIAKRKIVSPAKQEAVDVAYHLLHWSRYPSYGHVMDSGARPLQAFAEGTTFKYRPVPCRLRSNRKVKPRKSKLSAPDY